VPGYSLSSSKTATAVPTPAPTTLPAALEREKNSHSVPFRESFCCQKRVGNSPPKSSPLHKFLLIPLLPQYFFRETPSEPFHSSLDKPHAKQECPSASGALPLPLHGNWNHLEELTTISFITPISAVIPLVAAG